MPPSNPNDSWASGATRRSNLPRSTSVEYEKETQSTIRRLNVPPPSNRIPAHRTITKTTSIQHVPDSEDDEPPPVAHVRGKSPFQHVADAARSVLAPATFFMVRRSQEPEDTNGRDSSSYDYAEEEQQYQDQQAGPQPKQPSKRNTHKRGRISIDNKAYRPSVSDLEQSDEDFEEDGKKMRRRKKNKRDSVGGPLTSLPVAGYDRRKKRRRNTKGDGGEGEGDEDEDDESASDELEKVSDHVSIKSNIHPTLFILS
jgi:SUN domain-containing protein 1/2